MRVIGGNRLSKPAIQANARAMADFKPLFETRREPERIAKRLARLGYCSRREAERWIADGRIEVDGETLTTPAFTVGIDARIRVDGEPTPEREPPRLWRYNKARGRVTSAWDPEGRPTVFEAMPADIPRVISVGRLDIDSEGLLLLTNDGELARLLELPSTGWLRKYRVRARGRIEQETLDKLADGVTIDGVLYGKITATIDSATRTNLWMTVGLREGKNREVRRVFEHLGLTVNRLIRVSYGPFLLGDIEADQIEEVRRRVLLDQLGVRGTREELIVEQPAGKSDQAKSGQAKSGQAKSGQTKSGQAKPTRAKVDTKFRGSKPKNNRSESAKPAGTRLEPPPSRSDKSRPDRSGSDKPRADRGPASKAQTSKSQISKPGNSKSGRPTLTVKPGGDKPKNNQKAGSHANRRRPTSRV